LPLCASREGSFKTLLLTASDYSPFRSLCYLLLALSDPRAFAPQVTRHGRLRRPEGGLCYRNLRCQSLKFILGQSKAEILRKARLIALDCFIEAAAGRSVSPPPSLL
jgi:hypothetical protein